MPDWSRLSKLAGMLGSPHDGERVNAARLLEQALQRAGLTFADLAQRISSGPTYGETRTVVVEKWKPNPASEVARKILLSCGTKLTSTEATFLNGVVRDCEMSNSYSLTGLQLEWIKDLEQIYLLKTKKKYQSRQPRKPVPTDVLDDLGLGTKAGTYTGDEPRTSFKRTRRPYQPPAREVDSDMPDAREDVETKGNSAWAARKVDLDFDDDIGF